MKSKKGHLAYLLAAFGAFHYLCMENRNEMKVIEISSADDERVSVFSRLTEAQLRNRLHPEEALFIAESPCGFAGRICARKTVV